MTTSGDINDTSKFDGGVAPTSGADTLTINAGVNCTVPVGLSIAVGAITMTAGTSPRTTLTINGTLDLAGNVTMNTGCNLTMGAGATLDLNGNSITNAGTSAYTFTGTALSRTTIISTGSRGSFADPGGNGTVPTIAYCDFSGLDNVFLGRCHGATVPFALISYSTFADCGHINFDSTNVSANSGFLISHCDFRDPYTVAAGKYYPVVYNTAVTTTRDRKFEYCTWDSGGLAGRIWVRAENATIDKCVMQGFGITATPSLIVSNTLHNSTIGVSNGSFLSDTPSVTVRDSYIYYPDGNHPITSMSVSAIFEDCIFDGIGGGVGTNWFLYAVTSSAITVRRNVFLGKGNPLCYTGSGNPTIDFANNTILIDNAGDGDGGVAFATMMLTEQVSTLSGANTREFYNNLLIDPDSSTAQDAAIDLLNNTADQVTYLDYNAGWTYPAGATGPPVKYTAKVVVTAGKGVNDFAIDPNFVDRTRSIVTWDAELGGNGTFANAIAELLKLNASDYDVNYDVAALVAWTKAGYVPQAAALVGSGRSGADIGAMTPVPLAASGGASTVASTVGSTVGGIS